MSTKREQILAAIAATLAGTTGVGTRVYRSRQEAFSRQEAPAIIIEPGPDNPGQEPVSTCKIDWTLNVSIAVYARGNVPDQAADTVVLSLHSKLLADRTLGGLVMDIWPGGVDPQFDKGDLATVWMVCTYIIRYRTSVTDLSI